MRQSENSKAQIANAAPAPDGACWRFAVDRVRRISGVVLPVDYAAVLAAPEAVADEVPSIWNARAGDLVLLRGWFSAQDHVGVVIDAFRLVHLDSDGRAAEVETAAVRRAGLVKRVMRPRKKNETQRATEGHGEEHGEEVGDGGDGALAAGEATAPLPRGEGGEAIA